MVFERPKNVSSVLSRVRFRALVRAVLLGWVGLVAVGVFVLGVGLVVCPGALALGQRGHVFAFSFGAAGAGDGEFDGPSAVAVNQSDGDVYVADYGNNRVEVFEPELSPEGVLVGERFQRSFAVAFPDAVAVDSGLGVSDPSRGDVYVVGSTKREVREEEPNKRVFKFSHEGDEIAVLRSFKEHTGRGGERAEAEEFEELQGIAVDASGRLYAYGSGGVDVFDDAAGKNGGLFSVPAPLRATRGLALNSAGDLYVGHESENPEVVGLEGDPGVVGEIEGITGAPLVAELDGQASTAVAVNTADVPANGVDEENDVYVTNLGVRDGATVGSVAEFGPAGGLVQRFGVAGLMEPSGVAVDDESGAVFVADAASDRVDVFLLEAPGAPTVDSLGAKVQAPVAPASNTLDLDAAVDPHGSDTRYYFEYGLGSCAQGGCSNTAETDVGGGFGAQPARLELQDLAPGLYHYLVRASNGVGSVESAEQSFAVAAATSGLPDGRAWEMVSPPNKGAGAILALAREGGVVLAADDGDALAYAADGAITEDAESNRTPEAEQLLATRGPEGWSSQDLATPQIKAQGLDVGGAPEYRFFSPDLSLSLVEPWGIGGLAEPPLAAGVVKKTMYLRDDAPIQPEGAEEEAYRQAEGNRGFLAPGYLPLGVTGPVGATPDLSHVVVSVGGLSEWSREGVVPVSVLPDGAPASQVALGYAHVTAGAISSDGSRVIWTASQQSAAHLYMTDSASGQTIQLDAAVEGVAEPGEGSAEYQAASSDGSRVFFLDKQRLTKDATAEPGEGVGKRDLYECEIITLPTGRLACDLRDLTVEGDGEHADVQGLVLGASEDGESVYFIARGVLAGNESANGEAPAPGGENLYELHEQAGVWSTVFIGGLSGEDSPEWEGGEHANPSFLTARVSPDGRYLAFMSASSLTGYDNLDQVSGRRDEEVYLYDSATASLTCVSCNPSGAQPVGVFDTPNSGEGLGLLVDRRGVWSEHWLAGNIPGWSPQGVSGAGTQPRYLSDEGRLFFDSPDDLVAQATNHKNDVYEYEPTGIGSCNSATGGCVGLISSGESTQESAFLEATPDGSDVFFITAARLLPQDTDTAFDIYDARVCTEASPCLTPPAAPPEGCSSADACHPAIPPQQAPLQAAGSALPSGAGNPSSPAARQQTKAAKQAVKPLTRAQELTKALQACRKGHPHSKSARKACEALAHRRYGPTKKTAAGSKGQR